MMQDRETSGRSRLEHYGPDLEHSGYCHRGLVTGAVFFASRRRAAQRSEEQRERTREAFGSEYERMTQERGSEEEAERELRERRGRIERRGGAPPRQSRGRHGGGG